MPELRQNFFTKEWVIIATERAKRPEELATHRPPHSAVFLGKLSILPRQREQNPARGHAFSNQHQQALGGASHP